MKLKEIMSTIETFYKPDDTLIDVAKSLAEKHHSCGLICEYDKPMGIITERDIVRLLSNLASAHLEFDVPIKDVMTHQPICLDAETELVDALDLAKNHNLRHLPVVDSTQRLVGVVTSTDLVKAYLITLDKNIMLENQNRKLHILSIEDPLTGLPNRRAMSMDLRHAAAVARRRAESYSIAIIDLDYFKKYNDHYGHRAGDEALVEIAKTLRNNLRESEKIFRYGGEEFLFLMPATSIEAALIAAQRIRQAIADCEFPHIESPLGLLTVSIGVASGTSDNWEFVIEQADTALYDAKENGRNTLCFTEPITESGFWDFSRSSQSYRPSLN